MRYLALAIAVLCLLCPQEAAAHRLNVFAWLENDNIIVNCNFGKNRPARDAVVEVLDSATEKPLLKGATDAEGRFVFATPQAIDQGHGLLIRVNAGQGHMGQWTMNASELYAAASLEAGFEAANLRSAEAADSGGKKTLPSSPVMQNGPSDADIERIFQKCLAPLQKEIAELANPGPTISDIIGGLGWIMGLAGIGFYFSARRGR